MTTYFIFEQHSQSTSTFQRFRSVNGYEAQDTVEAASESKAMGKWLTDKSDAYDLFLNEQDGSLFEGASQRVVWAPGSTTGDFGDFTVYAYTMEEVKDDANLLKAALKANTMSYLFETEEENN